MQIRSARMRSQTPRSLSTTAPPAPKTIAQGSFISFAVNRTSSITAIVPAQQGMSAAFCSTGSGLIEAVVTAIASVEKDIQQSDESAYSIIVLVDNSFY